MDENYPIKITSGESSTALDIFEPAMHSLFGVSKTVIDAVLAGKIGTDK